MAVQIGLWQENIKEKTMESILAKIMPFLDLERSEEEALIKAVPLLKYTILKPKLDSRGKLIPSLKFLRSFRYSENEPVVEIMAHANFAKFIARSVDGELSQWDHFRESKVCHIINVLNLCVSETGEIQSPETGLRRLVNMCRKHFNTPELHVNWKAELDASLYLAKIKGGNEFLEAWEYAETIC